MRRTNFLYCHFVISNVEYLLLRKRIMKKFLIILSMLLCMPVFADTMPFYMDSVPKAAIGVLQTDKEIAVYSHPEANSELLKRAELSYKPESMPDNMFAVLINEKSLGFLYVTDMEEDGWVEVIYDKQTGARGWVQTADRLQFLPWINFYNLYGRKYGLRILKDAPKDMYVLRAQSEDLSQPLSKLNHIQKIKLTKVSGNWALVTVMDLDKTPKSGWLKWRDGNGVIYAFPNVK